MRYGTRVPYLAAFVCPRVKMNRMRLKIAARLKEAQNTNAMLTTFNELDMSNIMQLRKDNQDAFVKKHGIKMGFMSAFVKVMYERSENFLKTFLRKSLSPLQRTGTVPGTRRIFFLPRHIAPVSPPPPLPVGYRYYDVFGKYR